VPVLTRILLVEDDALQAEYSRQILESQRFYVEVAATGLDAVRKILAGWFDIVLMDHNIPDFDGVAVGRIIADLIRTQGRPRLIALSAVPDTIRARESGSGSVFDAIIAKPWNPLELMTVIRRCHQTLPPSTHRMEAVQSRLPVRHVPIAGRIHASRTQPVSVLVIDDDAALRAITGLALETEGYWVEQATNGVDALTKLVSAAFDVVVIDYQIPHVDGLATGRLIFDLIPHATRPRLVALTATPDRLVSQEAGQLSVFDEVVGKHDGMKALLAAVARCAHYKALRTQLAPPDVVRLDSIMGIAIDSL
jgi:CheY-like chemotaxis protein